MNFAVAPEFVHVQYAKSTLLSTDGSEQRTYYTAQIFSEYQSAEYEGYDTIEELQKAVNKDTLIDVLLEMDYNLFYAARVKGGVIFNGEWVDFPKIDFEEAVGECTS